MAPKFNQTMSDSTLDYVRAYQKMLITDFEQIKAGVKDADLSDIEQNLEVINMPINSKEDAAKWIKGYALVVAKQWKSETFKDKSTKMEQMKNIRATVAELMENGDVRNLRDIEAMSFYSAKGVIEAPSVNLTSTPLKAFSYGDEFMDHDKAFSKMDTLREIEKKHKKELEAKANEQSESAQQME